MKKLDFAEIYADHKEKVWRLVSRYVSLQPDKEDLFQEVFLSIHKALPRFRGESSISTWIYRIAVNSSINFLKKRNYYKNLKNVLNSFRLIEPEEPKVSEDLSLFKPLEKLNPQQRMVVVLADVEGNSLEEIAQIMKIPVGTVKSNLHRGREIIRNCKSGRLLKHRRKWISGQRNLSIRTISNR